MILITGATGLLGSFLVEYLLENTKYSIKLLIRNKNQISNFPRSNKLHFSIGDVNDLETLEDSFQDVEYVFHCAGLISFSPFEQENLKKVNIEGTANIVNFCLAKGINKLCHVSSVAAIGKAKNSLTSDEKVEWDNSEDNSYYGKTKYLGELEVWRGIEEGLNAVIVNPSVILGPADWTQSSMKLFNYVKAKNKYYTLGGNNFVDVRDTVKIMNSLMFSDIHSEKFIVAGERLEFKKLFDLMANALNVSPPSKPAKQWMINILWRLEHLKSLVTGKSPLITKETSKVSQRKHQYSSEKIIKQLNFSFTPVEDTIKWTVQKLSEKGLI